MSKNGSMKENILSIFLKENSHLLSDALGFQVDNIILEQFHAHRKIDIRAVDSKRRIPIFIEVQLSKANSAYLNRMIEMIERFNESVIIWIAKSFDDDILDELKKWFESHQKEFVDFYALSLHEDAISVLQKLNEMYSLDIYKNFHLLREMNPLLIVELVNLQIHPSHCGQINTNPSPPDFDRTEDVKRAMLQVLRSKIPFFLNFHYDKKTNQNDRILTCGAGKSGIIYRCSARDVRNLAFVELYFDKAVKDWYEAFENIADELRKSVYPDLTFGKRRIGVYFKPKESNEQTFEEIARIFKKMIDGFSPYIYKVKELPVKASAVPTDKFVQVPIVLPEQPFSTEDSYRIAMEDYAEMLLGK
ncbi:hypothetical protein H5P36_20055 [Bacillus sp. APMAM]|nr:hypothetical protein [Bacillus sp. APMAM]RTZ54083.1 hypothetical protein EKO25_19830 [Bacillus sp. SAJ1]